jgi:hypothetical protein
MVQPRIVAQQLVLSAGGLLAESKRGQLVLSAAKLLPKITS